jgi:hypothetical protein
MALSINETLPQFNAIICDQTMGKIPLDVLGYHFFGQTHIALNLQGRKRAKMVKTIAVHSCLS